MFGPQSEIGLWVCGFDPTRGQYICLRHSSRGSWEVWSSSRDNGDPDVMCFTQAYSGKGSPGPHPGEVYVCMLMPWSLYAYTDEHIHWGGHVEVLNRQLIIGGFALHY